MLGNCSNKSTKNISLKRNNSNNTITCIICSIETIKYSSSSCFNKIALTSYCELIPKTNNINYSFTTKNLKWLVLIITFTKLVTLIEDCLKLIYTLISINPALTLPSNLTLNLTLILIYSSAITTINTYCTSNSIIAIYLTTNTLITNLDFSSDTYS